MIDKKLLLEIGEKQFSKLQKNKIMIFGALKELDIDWDKKEKTMKEFREEVDRRINKTIKKMNQNLKN